MEKIRNSILIVLVLSAATFSTIQARATHNDLLQDQNLKNNTNEAEPANDLKNKTNEADPAPSPAEDAAGAPAPSSDGHEDPEESSEEPDFDLEDSLAELESNPGKGSDKCTEENELNPGKSSDKCPAKSSEEIPVRNTTRRGLIAKRHSGPCIAHNPIDKCWRCNPNWEKDRKKLAGCAMGFGRKTFGGRDGPIYSVTDELDSNAAEPKPGTLRHAVIQKGPLWITFAKSMNITLKQELLVQSDKTIDGRGRHIRISGGGGISMQGVRNIIIHNIHLNDIHPTSGGMIRESVDHVGQRGDTDGDAISIFNSTDVWIDHVSASRAKDGLIDVVAASTNITISNCHFVQHDKVMLFGAQDTNEKDKNMRVTVAYTHFGKNLVQRMPRVRWGFIHLVNNDYTHWLMYAIGGTKGCSIISQGNRFTAPPNPIVRQVTYRNDGLTGGWQSWNWRSEGDLMLNGAFFVESGSPNWKTGIDPADLIAPAPAVDVATLTLSAGPLGCKVNKPC